MGLIGDKLIKVIPPKQREVWMIEDSELRMHPDKRNDKNGRPALILASTNFLNDSNYPLLNVIPLSTSVQPDTLIFPIASAYEELAQDFIPNKKSCAIIPFYQPIELKYFIKRCGTIEENAYNAIVHILCTEIIGYDSYDFNLD